MIQAKIKFDNVSLFVKDLDESMYYYKRLGFIAENIDETDEYQYCDLKLPSDSDFKIRLKKSFKVDENIGKLYLEFTADYGNGFSHREAFEELLNHGIRFSNLEAWEMNNTILNVGELKDPDGLQINLVE